jgi:uncharacterized membrane protein
MAKDLGDAIGTALGRAAREAAQTVATNARKTTKSGSLSGAKGFAAGAGLVALAPLAAKGAGKLAQGAKDSVGKAGKNMLPRAGGGNRGGDKNDMPGVGKGRRMPIQQAIDVAVPISTAYNQWTQFEDWPEFMHRLERVSQEDECHVSFKTKIWGISKEFNAEIVEQRPDERIKWRVTEGVTHTGVVTFHELADRLTRVEVNLDVDPGSLIEKVGRGMRHVERAVSADLARFKAYIEMEEEETGSWRGVIEDGAVKKRSSSSRSKSSSSGARSRSSSSRSKGSSNGRGSSGGGRRSGSRSGSSRQKSGSRS